VFIQLKYSGYNRHGEQSAAGRFLILMQPDTFQSEKYPHWAEVCKCGLRKHEHTVIPHVPACAEHGIVARLRARAGGTEQELDAILAGEKYHPACAPCQAHRAYAEHCHQFFPPANPAPPLRAIVRYVRLRQLGHFMMGSARVGKTRLTLSGSYGHDGLPVTVPDEVYEAGAPLPPELYEAWNKGGGWNSAGSEAEAMRRWAKQNLIAARKER
jgi:hypothetical protein